MLTVSGMRVQSKTRNKEVKNEVYNQMVAVELGRLHGGIGGLGPEGHGL